MAADKDEGKKEVTDVTEGYRLGKCKWFNVAKGWGFLTPKDDEDQEVFVHQSVIKKDGFRSLGDEEEVEFKAEQSSKGLEAVEVRAVGGGEVEGSHRRPGGKAAQNRRKMKKVRCYNCGDFGSHLASNCPQDPLPKRCHNCKSSDHLIEECPTLPESEKRQPKEKAEDKDKSASNDDEDDGWKDQERKKNKNSGRKKSTKSQQQQHKK